MLSSASSKAMKIAHKKSDLDSLTLAFYCDVSHTRKTMLNTIHRSLAGLILLFIIIHLCNHLVGIAGVEAHLEFMEWARNFYRNSYIEPVLLSAILVQVFLGLYLIYRSWGKRIGFSSEPKRYRGATWPYFLLHI